MAWLMPLCVVSGATTTTRPKRRATSMAAAMPRESYPSSLVTNINRSFIILPFCGAKIAHKSGSRSDIFAPMRENPKIIPNFAVPSGTYINLFHWA